MEQGELSDFQKGRLYITKNNVFFKDGFVDIDWFKTQTSQKWEFCKNHDIGKRTNFFIAILNELSKMCEEKARRFLLSNTNEYYLLYLDDGSINKNSIWWSVLPTINYRCYEFINGERNVIFKCTRYKDYKEHICGDSCFYKLGKISNELKDITSPDKKLMENHKMIKMYLMLAHVGILDTITPECLKDITEWSDYFDHNRNNDGYLFARVLFDDVEINGNNAETSFSLSKVIAMELGISPRYMYTKEGHMFFKLTQKQIDIISKGDAILNTIDDFEPNLEDFNYDQPRHNLPFQQQNNSQPQQQNNLPSQQQNNSHIEIPPHNLDMLNNPQAQNPSLYSNVESLTEEQSQARNEELSKRFGVNFRSRQNGGYWKILRRLTDKISNIKGIGDLKLKYFDTETVRNGLKANRIPLFQYYEFFKDLDKDVNKIMNLIYNMEKNGEEYLLYVKSRKDYILNQKLFTFEISELSSRVNPKDPFFTNANTSKLHDGIQDFVVRHKECFPQNKYASYYTNIQKLKSVANRFKKTEQEAKIENKEFMRMILIVLTMFGHDGQENEGIGKQNILFDTQTSWSAPNLCGHRMIFQDEKRDSYGDENIIKTRIKLSEPIDDRTFYIKKFDVVHLLLLASLDEMRAFVGVIFSVDEESDKLLKDIDGTNWILIIGLIFIVLLICFLIFIVAKKKFKK